MGFGVITQGFMRNGLYSDQHRKDGELRSDRHGTLSHGIGWDA